MTSTSKQQNPTRPFVEDENRDDEADENLPRRKTVPIVVFFSIQMILGACVFGGLGAIFVESQRITTDNTVKELIRHNMQTNRLKIWTPVDRVLIGGRLLTNMLNDTALGLHPYDVPGGLTPEEYVPILRAERVATAIHPMIMYASIFFKSNHHFQPDGSNRWDVYGSSKVCSARLINHTALDLCNADVTVEAYKTENGTQKFEWPISGAPFIKTMGQMTPAEIVGAWEGPDVFFDRSLQTTSLTLRYMLPFQFNSEGLATHVTAFTINATYMSSIISGLATTSNSILAFHNLGNHRMVAWNRDEPGLNSTAQQMYPSAETPDKFINEAYLNTVVRYRPECANVKFTAEGKIVSRKGEFTSALHQEQLRIAVACEDDTTSLYETSDGTYLVASARVTDERGFNGLLVEAVPKEHYYGALQRSRTLGIVVAVIASVIGSIITVVHLHLILRPLKKLKTDLHQAGKLAFSSAEGPQQLSSYITEIDEVAQAGSRLTSTLFLLKRFIPDTLMRHTENLYNEDSNSNRSSFTAVAGLEEFELENPADTNLGDDHVLADTPNPLGSGTTTPSAPGNSPHGSTSNTSANMGIEVETELLQKMVLMPSLLAAPATKMASSAPDSMDSAGVVAAAPSTVVPIPTSFDGRGGDANHGLSTTTQAALVSRKVTLIWVAVSYSGTEEVKAVGTATSLFLTAVTARLHESGGIIEELRPDSALLSFNAHYTCINHEQQATTFATKIAKRLQRAQDKGAPIHNVRIAVDTSTALVGLFHGTGRSFRAVLGDGVRAVEHLATMGPSIVGTDIIISERTKRCLPSRVNLVVVDRVQLQQNHSAVGDIEPEAWTIPSDTAFDDGCSTVLPKAENSRLFVYAFGSRCPAILQLRASSELFKDSLVALCRGNLDSAEKKFADMVRTYANNNNGEHAQLDFAAANLKRLIAHYRKVLKHNDEPLKVSHCQGKGFDWMPLKTQKANEGEGDASSAMSNSGTTTSKKQVAIHNALRDAVAEAEEELPSNDDFMTFAAVNTDNGITDLPTMLVDESGTKWHRSPKPFATGAFSEVYQGIGDNATLIAIKVLRLQAQVTDVDALKSELSLAVALRHPNITTHLSWCLVERQFVCLFMEWLPGGALSQVLNSYGLMRKQVIHRVVTESLNGLDYLHTQGVVHSDIKPHNLLLATDGTIKLGDFGSALSTRSTTQKHVNSSSGSQTPSGGLVVRGTAWYMAPEVAAGLTPTFASDMWSFAITILELILGHLPWNESQRFQNHELQFIRILGRRIPTFVPDIPPPKAIGGDLHALLTSCLNVDSTQRPTAAQLLQSDYVIMPK